MKTRRLRAIVLVFGAAIGPALILAACSTKRTERVPTERELRLNVMRMWYGAKSYWESNYEFPPRSADWNPPNTACDGSRRRSHRTADWKTSPTWEALNFDPSFGDDVYIGSYRYSIRGNEFVVEARADLKCDGKLTVVRRTGRVVDNMRVESPDPEIPLD